ncbi:glycosyltransferase 87 family protein [Kitasatospora sp. NBC_00374]|uniref:glycosyltransferase 87 family protein n=1 Tax=Kitasatospora sp. NBC_00374 TaxID=2975964 RepID=UPI003251BD0A
MRLPATGRRAVVLLALAGATGLFLAVIPGHRGWFDVGVYYGTVRHWTDGGPLYDYVHPNSTMGFTYPPFAAVCMLPMALVGWHTAVAISVVLSALAAAALLRWLVDPVARRMGWNRWFAFGVAGCLFGLLEPVRDTFSFGQVNLLLVALVLADWRLLAGARGGAAPGREDGDAGRRRSRYAGIGIGLAAAFKLTPAVFILYLAVTRRRRAALVATGTAAAATLLGRMADPEASYAFWTDLLWHTDRVGSLGYVSNQSLQGMIVRLAPDLPGRAVWGLAVLCVLAVWGYRVHRAAAAGDEAGGFALTGLAACLISPITWVHHLVWALPALLLLAEAGLREPADSARRRRLLTAAVTGYVLLCSSVVWLWRFDTGGVGGLVGGSAYLWITLGLLLGLPIRPVRAAADPPGEDAVAGRPVPAGRTVGTAPGIHRPAGGESIGAGPSRSRRRTVGSGGRSRGELPEPEHSATRPI